MFSELVESVPRPNDKRKKWAVTASVVAQAGMPAHINCNSSGLYTSVAEGDTQLHVGPAQHARRATAQANSVDSRGTLRTVAARPYTD
jgi:hypothetical protein